MKRKWYEWLIYAITFVLAGAVGWFINWWNSPLGEPLCVARGADAVLPALRQLQGDYMLFWIVAFLPFLTLVVWIAISLHRIARRDYA